MAKSLIIVESPAKTRTLKNFLGAGYDIEASMGHVRDLPKSKLGVEVENGFKPQYVAIPERKDVIKKLKGPKGTTVTLTVQREGVAEPLTFTIKRDTIPTASVPLRGNRPNTFAAAVLVTWTKRFMLQPR